MDVIVVPSKVVPNWFVYEILIAPLELAKLKSVSGGGVPVPLSASNSISMELMACEKLRV